MHGDAGDDQHGLKVHSVLDLDLDKKNPVPMDTDVNKYQTAPVDLDLHPAQAEPSPFGQATGAATAGAGQDCPRTVGVGGSSLPRPEWAKAATSSDATQPSVGLGATDSSAAQPSSSGAAAAPFAAAAAAERSSMVAAAAAAATSSEPHGTATPSTEVVDLTEEASPKSNSAGQGEGAGALLPGEAATAAAELRPGAAATAGTLPLLRLPQLLARCCLTQLPQVLARCCLV